MHVVSASSIDGAFMQFEFLSHSKENFSLLIYELDCNHTTRKYVQFDSVSHSKIYWRLDCAITSVFNVMKTTKDGLHFKQVG